MGSTRPRERQVNDSFVYVPAFSAPLPGCGETLRAMKPLPEEMRVRCIQPGEPLGDVQRLRREVYFHEQGQEREKSRRISDGLDGSGTVVVVEKGRHAVATLRLHDFGSPAVQVEYGSLFQLDQFARAWPLQRLGAMTRFAVQAEQRDPSVVDLLLAETYRNMQENGIQFSLFACEASFYGVFERYGFREYLPPAILPSGVAVLRMVLVIDDAHALRQAGSPLLSMVRNATSGTLANDWLLRAFPAAR